MTGSDGLGPILADLEETGVHVAPSAEGWLDDAELARLEEQVAASPDPVYVVLADPGDDAAPQASDDLAFRLHDAGGGDGLYVGIDGVLDLDGTDYQWSAQQWGPVAGEEDVTSDVTLYLEYGDDGEGFEPAEGLLGLTGHLADGTFAEVRQEGSEGLSTAADRGREEEGLLSGPTPVILGVVVLAALAATVLGLRRRSRGRAVPDAPARPSGRGYALPDSVLDRVREAGDAEAGRRAQAAVLALGEDIDAADLDAGSPGSAQAWQQALDHYDAATRLLPADAATDPTAPDHLDVLDVVGALVLAERGSAALAAARDGGPVRLPRTCFLNPLHPPLDPGADGARPIEHDGRRIEAPLCRACREDLEAGRRPDVLDVLDGPDGGRPVHYFETDREPWASTGFGAFDDDLLTRLHRSAG